MKIKCLLLGHKWNGCVCLRCGKNQHKHHEWDGCVCRICGEADRLAPDEAHQWDGCRCKKCGAYAPDARHDWELIKQERTENESDEWYGGHFVTMTTATEVNTYRCRRCGRERQDVSSGF